MKIYIMRHGEAEHFADSDAQRQLTPRGRKESEIVAQACVEAGAAQFDKVLVSPYIRAQQTWQEVASCFQSTSIVTCEDITPYGQSEVVADYVCALADVEQLESVLLVSHLPLVGYLTAEFVAGIQPPMFPTSGMVCIDYDLKARKGELVWQLKA